MAQRVKKSNDDKIAEKEAAIEKLKDSYKNKLARLQAEKKELVEKKERDDKDELTSMIASSGITADELREILENIKRT